MGATLALIIGYLSHLGVATPVNSVLVELENGKSFLAELEDKQKEDGSEEDGQHAPAGDYGDVICGDTASAAACECGEPVKVVAFNSDEDVWVEACCDCGE